MFRNCNFFTSVAFCASLRVIFAYFHGIKQCGRAKGHDGGGDHGSSWWDGYAWYTSKSCI